MISRENRMKSTFDDIFSNSLNENRMESTFVDIFSNSLNENRMESTFVDIFSNSLNKNSNPCFIIENKQSLLVPKTFGLNYLMK